MLIGIDVGGTKIAIGAVSNDGRVICKSSVETGRTRTGDEITLDIIKLCEKVISDAGAPVSAIGIGFPGTVDSKNGKVVYSCNFPLITDFAICKRLSDRFGVAVNIENDANAAALAEYSVNANGCECFVMVTLGTGVGGGVIINGRIFRGSNCAGTELGHITLIKDGLPCGCGRNGCFESYASARALVTMAEQKISDSPDSSFAKLANGREVDGKLIFEAASKGDSTALALIEEYAQFVGAGLTDIVNIFQPEVLAVGGGISAAGELLLAPIRHYVEKYDYNKYLTKVKIIPALLGNDAGIIGAAISAVDITKAC